MGFTYQHLYNPWDHVGLWQFPWLPINDMMILRALLVCGCVSVITVVVIKQVFVVVLQGASSIKSGWNVVMMMLVIKKWSVAMFNLLTNVMIQCMLSLMNHRCFTCNNNWIAAVLWLSFCLGTPRAVHNQRYKRVTVVPPKCVTLSRLMENIGWNILFEAYCSLCLCGHEVVTYITYLVQRR